MAKRSAGSAALCGSQLVELRGICHIWTVPTVRPDRIYRPQLCIEPARAADGHRHAPAILLAAAPGTLHFRRRTSG